MSRRIVLAYCTKRHVLAEQLESEGVDGIAFVCGVAGLSKRHGVERGRWNVSGSATWVPADSDEARGLWPAYCNACHIEFDLWPLAELENRKAGRPPSTLTPTPRH